MSDSAYPNRGPTYRRRSKIETDLPADVREQVNQLLVNNETYEDIAAFLQTKGYDISKSSIGRYGQQFAEAYQKVLRFSAQAKTLTGEGVESLVLDEAAGHLLMQKVLENLIDDKVPFKDVSKLIGDVAKLQSSNVNREKFKAEVAQKARAELMEEQKQQLNKAVKTGGLDPEIAERARQILGFE